ncbi:MAG: radical SAM protein [Candidatus Brocadiaceae bacterium]|nr:radical SAM protein [Candidatus Brocadiaceae bacterium]
MIICEIFKSIQGETSYAGLPCTFIRVTGCNLRCRCCDTAYAYEDGTELSMSAILDATAEYNTKLVCISGGEPLSNKETPLLVQNLLHNNYTVLVETNGSYDISILPQGTIRIMDIKCPDSLMHHAMHWQNIHYLRKTDEVKFVLFSRQDYDWAKEIIREHRLSSIATVLIGTAYGVLPSKSVVQWILEDNLEVRFQLQLHKYIWDPCARGV